MKLLIALCVFSQASAFTTLAPKNAFSTSLPLSDRVRSTIDNGMPYSTTNLFETEQVPSTTRGDAYTRELERRLKRLEGPTNSRSSSTSRLDGTGRTTRPLRNDMRTPVTRQTRSVDAPRVLIQGDSLKTWSFASPAVERVQVRLSTEGRPLSANIELWQGPDNTPHKMRVYNEDGNIRPFNCVMLTPRGPNTIAVRNSGQMEFPMAAIVSAETEFVNPEYLTEFNSGTSMTIQGGALKTYPFDPSVESVQILIKTDGRPLNARVELLQGPNNNKQVVEIYTEDGNYRPFFMIIETPLSGNVVRVVNTSPVEFPMTASVEPYRIGRYDAFKDVVIGGDADEIRW